MLLMVLLAPLACMPRLPIHGSKRNEVDRVQTLIQEGADIEPKHFGWSPLMRASCSATLAILPL